MTKQTTKETTKEIVKAKDTKLTPATVETFTKFTSVQAMLEFGAEIAKSKLSPLKTASDVMVAMLMGKELGFGVMTSINNIYPINGRASLGVHIISAILQKHGVTYDIEEDYVPIYLYKDKQGNEYDHDYFINHMDKYQLVNKDTKPESVDKTKVQVIRTLVDRRYKMKFRRKVKQADGTWVESTYTHYLLWSECEAMSWTTNDNWKKQPRNMHRIACLRGGAKIACADGTLGLLETSELAQIENVDYEIAEDGEVIVHGDKKITPKSNKHVEEATIVAESKDTAPK